MSDSLDNFFFVFFFFTKIRARTFQNLESNYEPLLSYDSEATSSRPSSDAYSITSTLCRTSIVSPTRNSFDCSVMDIIYNTGSREEVFLNFWNSRMKVKEKIVVRIQNR